MEDDRSYFNPARKAQREELDGWNDETASLQLKIIMEKGDKNMEKREDFYEPPLCPNCNNVLTVVKSKETWGIEWDLYCEHCFYQDTNLVKGR